MTRLLLRVAGKLCSWALIVPAVLLGLLYSLWVIITEYLEEKRND